jgi:hypothetical protein
VHCVPADSCAVFVEGLGRADGFIRKETALYRDQPQTLAVENCRARIGAFTATSTWLCGLVSGALEVSRGVHVVAGA